MCVCVCVCVCMCVCVCVCVCVLGAEFFCIYLVFPANRLLLLSIKT